MTLTVQYHVPVVLGHERMLSLKRSHCDMRGSRLPVKWIDSEHYCTTILRLPSNMSEADMDRSIMQEADDLGIPHLRITIDVEQIPASLSATTIASEPAVQTSIKSHSTAPTSCSSSEYRPLASPTPISETLLASPVPSSILADSEKKRKLGFRNGIRKMTGFGRKRRSLTLSSPTLTSTSCASQSEVNNLCSPTQIDAPFIRKGSDADSVASARHQQLLKSPSVRSQKSSGGWSTKASATTKSSYDHNDSLIDHDVLQRTLESTELTALRTKQMDERQRFLDYQTELITKIRDTRDTIKAQRREFHVRMVQEQIRKNEKAIEDLESRQLEDELKMIKEHENEKRSIVARLKHMEAYCQNPSPPPTPVEATFSVHSSLPSPTDAIGASADFASGAMILPERKVTDRDYHSLASCYRERDAMGNLHVSKINVLRGKQKRAVENLILKKEKEIERLEDQNEKELEVIDLDCGMQEAECRAELWEKRQALERRWRLQAMIEKTRSEKASGLTFERLPVVSLVEGEALHGLGIVG